MSPYDKIPIDQLERFYKANLVELRKLTDEIENKIESKKEVITNLALVLEFLDRLKNEHPERKLPELEIPEEFQKKDTIGDAMEKILLRRGAMRRKELIGWLRKDGIKFSQKNPQQVIANAIKLDGRKRFIVLPDRRVSVRKENEK